MRKIVTVDSATFDRFETAAFFERQTVPDLLDEAMSEKVDKLESERGEPYPKR